MHINSKALRIIFGILSLAMVSLIALYYIPIGIHNLELLRTTLRELIVSPTDCYIYVGDSTTASFTMVPNTAIATVSWSDAGDGIITIDQSGTVTALSEGSTHFTLTGDNGVSTSVEVIALRKPLPPDSDYPPLYDEPLLIANAGNPLPSNYVPELVTIPKSYPANRVGMQLTPETFDAFERMYADAYTAVGRRCHVISAYRSYQKQQSLFDEDIARYRAMGYDRDTAIRLTAQATQYPGCSEHQLGLSIDIGELSNSFAYTALGKWLTTHAHEYGFILRYPADKVEITGISHEAWHFRYVGIGHATYIYEHGLCLEEYVELQKQAQQAAVDYAASVPAEQYVAMLRQSGQAL